MFIHLLLPKGSSLPRKTLLHEFASHVEKTPEASGGAAARSCTSSAHLALHVELESHLSGLGNSILLVSARILVSVSCVSPEEMISTYCLALALLLVEQLCSLRHGQSNELALTALSLL